MEGNFGHRGLLSIVLQIASHIASHLRDCPLTRLRDPVAKLHRSAERSILIVDWVGEGIASRTIALHTLILTGIKHAAPATRAMPISTPRGGIGNQPRRDDSSKRITFFCPAAQNKEKLSVIVPHNDLPVNVEIEDSFNKCSQTLPIRLLARPLYEIIFNRHSNLLMSRSIGQGSKCAINACVADWISTSLDCDFRRDIDGALSEKIVPTSFVFAGGCRSIPVDLKYRSDVRPAHVTFLG